MYTREEAQQKCLLPSYANCGGVTCETSPDTGCTVRPSPATHAILAVLKAGETVYQAGELPKTLRVSKTHCELPKTVCKIPFASIFPPSMENGDGARYCELLQEQRVVSLAGSGSGPSRA